MLLHSTVMLSTRSLQCMYCTAPTTWSQVVPLCTVLPHHCWCAGLASEAVEHCASQACMAELPSHIVHMVRNGKAISHGPPLLHKLCKWLGSTVHFKHPLLRNLHRCRDRAVSHRPAAAVQVAQMRQGVNGASDSAPQPAPLAEASAEDQLVAATERLLIKGWGVGQTVSIKLL